MSPAPSDQHRDALSALERLVNRHHVLSLEEARAAARLITGDPDVQFPPPRPERPERQPPAAGEEGQNGAGSGGAQRRPEAPPQAEAPAPAEGADAPGAPPPPASDAS